MSDRSHSGDGEPSFGELVGKVRRLHHDTVVHERPRPPARPRHVHAEGTSKALLPQRASDLAPQLGHDDGAEAPEFHRSGLQHSVLRKLRRGQYPVQDELDLHGLNVREAGQRLGVFLAYARGQYMGCVRIIPGKGLSSPGRAPVLKPQVARWLRDHPAVLAFTPARRDDGGDGAMYVLLRSRRD